MGPAGWIVVLLLAIGVFVVVSFVLKHLAGLIALAAAVFAGYCFYRALKHRRPVGGPRAWKTFDEEDES